MSPQQSKSGFVNINKAKLYYEIAGAGASFVMIHAGVADSRQWNNEFEYFSQSNQVIRYDMRGYGKSEPVDGEFSHMSDLVALLDTLRVHEPIIIMGCSMGGGLAMDFALTHPSRVKALVMVDSATTLHELKIPPNNKLEALSGDRKGQHSIRINDQYRICFVWTNLGPDQVEIVDYH